MGARPATIADQNRQAGRAAAWATQTTPVTVAIHPKRDPHGAWWTIACDHCGPVAPLPVGSGTPAGPRTQRWRTLDRRPPLSTRNRLRALDTAARHAVAAHPGHSYRIAGSAA